ncbi:hypothetical protein CspHIS471_0200020 [Cutaneotrichosporon sp. HIS471]|nr:hypothetical protein CspHIS471_0200020 [Cutaneotrichosporon sp. HIS471]
MSPIPHPGIAARTTRISSAPTSAPAYVSREDAGLLNGARVERHQHPDQHAVTAEVMFTHMHKQPQPHSHRNKPHKPRKQPRKQPRRYPAAYAKEEIG